MPSKAWATPRASMSGVPLKSMCSIRWLIPATSSLSSRLPARIQTPKETLVASSRGSEKTRKPPGRSFLTMLGSLKGLILQLLEGDAVLLVYLQHPHLHAVALVRSEEHTSELQSRQYLVCRLLLEKKNILAYLLL